MKRLGMKRITLLGLAVMLRSLPLLAQGVHPAPDKPSVHGMLLFGRGKVYASHLPMFHAPHNYQVILELNLDQKDQARFVEDQQRHPEEATYTLAPGRFVLPDMLAAPRPFKAVLYRGHFERGGTPVTDSVTVRIGKVIYAERFTEAAAAAPTTNYLLFGNAREQFAAHVIRKAPDFDHIQQVKATLPGGAAFTEVMVNDKANAVPGTGGNTVEATTRTGQKVSLTWLRQLYLEFDDLR